jgi:hypothetical protein
LTSISKEHPETQLLIQLLISAPILFVVASFGFLFWFKLIATYKAFSVASFSFLAPVLSVLFGLLTLGRTGWTKSYRSSNTCGSWIDIDYPKINFSITEIGHVGLPIDFLFAQWPNGMEQRGALSGKK